MSIGTTWRSSVSAHWTRDGRQNPGAAAHSMSLGSMGDVVRITALTVSGVMALTELSMVRVPDTRNLPVSPAKIVDRCASTASASLG